MDKYFRDLIVKSTPLTNPLIMNGLSVAHMAHVEEYINDVLVSASNGFPDGLEYMGCEQCTPQEEFNEVTRARNNKRNVNLARSDLYYMKYYFRYKGVDLPPRYLYLPFVGEAGTMFLGGSRYVVTPILTDRVISPGHNNVFVRLLRDKVTFFRVSHPVIINNKRYIGQVVWSSIYRKSKEAKKMVQTTKAVTSAVHYLLAKYGFYDMFSMFAGFKPVVGGSEINEDTYPLEEWVIIKSAGYKPKTYVGNFYKPSEIVVAVPIHHWTPFVKDLVTGFFYTVDHFPERINPSNVNDKNRWMVLLGHIIVSGVYGENKLYSNVAEHFTSLDEYVDMMVSKQLLEIGHECKDFYELLVVIIKNFNDWLIKGSDQTNSLYGKELSILYHILFDITSAIFRTSFRLNKIASKKELTIKEITEVMNKNMRVGLIYSITRSHVNMTNVNYSGDNKFFKITSMMVPQASASNKTARTKQSRTVANDPNKKIHASIAEAGSFLYLPKSSPRGDSRINPFIKLDNRSTVIRDPSKIDLLDSVADKFKGIV